MEARCQKDRCVHDGIAHTKPAAGGMVCTQIEATGPGRQQQRGGGVHTGWGGGGGTDRWCAETVLELSEPEDGRVAPEPVQQPHDVCLGLAQERAPHDVAQQAGVPAVVVVDLLLGALLALEPRHARVDARGILRKLQHQGFEIRADGLRRLMQLVHRLRARKDNVWGRKLRVRVAGGCHRCPRRARCSNEHHDIRTRPTKKGFGGRAGHGHQLPAMPITATQGAGGVCVDWVHGAVRVGGGACAPHLNVAPAAEPLLLPRRQLGGDAHNEAAHGVVRVGFLEQDAKPPPVVEEGDEVEDKLGRGGRERGQRRFQHGVFPRHRRRALRLLLRLLLRGEPAIAEEWRHRQGDGRERVVQGTPVPAAPPGRPRHRRCGNVCVDARQSHLPARPARAAVAGPFPGHCRM